MDGLISGRLDKYIAGRMIDITGWMDKWMRCRDRYMYDWEDNWIDLYIAG